MKTKILADFQICISVPLIRNKEKNNDNFVLAPSITILLLCQNS